ncbi:Aspartic protease, partial [Lachnellula suecica]
LLVDTGSADLVLNSGRYQRSSSSIQLNRTFDITYGTTEGTTPGDSSATITGVLYKDTVTYSSLIVNAQTTGAVISNASDSSDVYPHDGIIGLGAQIFSGSNSTLFFHNLCDQNLISECRFGLALEGDGTGTLTFGAIGNALQGGEQSLTRVPIIEEWFVGGDLAVNGSVIQRDLVVEFDSGTSGIIGPIDAVSTLFEMVGIQGVLQPSASGDVLVGYFPCGTPSAVGLSLPSKSNISATMGLSGFSDTSKVFNVLADAMSAGPVDADGKNCTFAISGFDVVELPGLWVFGQAFSQGKYMDHNFAAGSLGLAELNSTSQVASNASVPSASKPMITSTASYGREIQSFIFEGIAIAASLLLLA